MNVDGVREQKRVRPGKRPALAGARTAEVRVKNVQRRRFALTSRVAVSLVLVLCACHRAGWLAWRSSRSAVRKARRDSTQHTAHSAQHTTLDGRVAVHSMCA